MSEPRYFCAVPARGGSERLARKNVLPLAGQPMIAHTIRAALATGRFDFFAPGDEMRPIRAFHQHVR